MENKQVEQEMVMNNENNENNEDLIQKQAIANLINGIQIAQSRGAYTLDESSELLKSIQVFLVKK